MSEKVTDSFVLRRNKTSTLKNSSPSSASSCQQVRLPSQRPEKIVGCKDGGNTCERIRQGCVREKSSGSPEIVASKEMRLSTSVVSVGRKSVQKMFVDFVQIKEP